MLDFRSSTPDHNIEYKVKPVHIFKTYFLASRGFNANYKHLINIIDWIKLNKIKLPLLVQTDFLNLTGIVTMYYLFVQNWLL